MLKKVILIFLVILAGCGNPPASKEKAIKKDSHVRHKAVTVKPEANLWTINSFAPREGETEKRKYVRFETEGNFSDSTQTEGYVFAEVLIDKIHAGIFLHKLKKSNPPEKFEDSVHIKMTNSSGQELQMTSTRMWNSSGGILIERNNNDYSRLRIFLLQNTGNVMVEVTDTGENNNYHFNLNTDGFSDSFSKL